MSTSPSRITRRLLTSGAGAGAASAFVFTALHHLLISDTPTPETV